MPDVTIRMLLDAGGLCFGIAALMDFFRAVVSPSWGF
jgi:hypothetical protein